MAEQRSSFDKTSDSSQLDLQTPAADRSARSAPAGAGRTEPPPKESTELFGMSEREIHRKQVDNAKKRAVAQGEPYEQFKQMAAAAHLTPIQSKHSSRRSSAHAPIPSTNGESLIHPGELDHSDAALTASVGHQYDGDITNAPSSVSALEKSLRRIGNTEKRRSVAVCDLLAECEEHSGLHETLRVEVPAGLARDAVQCLHTECTLSGRSPEDERRMRWTRTATAFVNALRQAPRVALTVTMLGRGGRKQLTELIEFLAQQTNECNAKSIKDELSLS